MDIFTIIQPLYLSNNQPRDRQIVDRVTALYQDALAEDEYMVPTSIVQFREFFLSHPNLVVPKITLTPDGMLRTRWMRGLGDFVAIEFTGGSHAKLFAEIPRDHELTATYLGREPLANIVAAAEAMGASFT